MRDKQKKKEDMSAFLMNQREKVCWISSALGWPLAEARANASFNREKSLFFSEAFPIVEEQLSVPLLYSCGETLSIQEGIGRTYLNT